MSDPRKLASALEAEMFSFLDPYHNSSLEKKVHALFLPKGCMHHFVRAESGSLFIEQKPMFRMLSIIGRMPEKEIYNIPLPYVIFKVNYHLSATGHYRYCGLNIYFRNSSLSQDDSLYDTPFPNVLSKGSVCMPMDDEANFTSINDLCRAAINTFWESSFEDYFLRTSFSRNTITNFSDWSKLSLEDVLQVKWKLLSSASRWEKCPPFYLDTPEFNKRMRKCLKTYDS